MTNVTPSGAELHEADTILRDRDARVGTKQIKAMAEELVRRGVVPEELGRVSRMKLYQGLTKDDDGNAHIHDMWGFHLDPSWETGPNWPVIQQAPAVKITGRTSAKKQHTVGPWKDCLVIPDMQGGYFRTGLGKFEPTHDTILMEVFIKIVAAVKPSVIIMLGDNLDLPEFGRYRQHPAFQQTTQIVVDYMGAWVARVRAAAGPDCEIVWLAGNHEERLPNFIIDNARAAFGIKQANQPKGWPVLSVPHLLRLDEVDVDYLPGYPANRYELTPEFHAVHGHFVKSKGYTAHTYLEDEDVSVIYGHIHRREWAERTIGRTGGERRVKMAASPGCACRVDGTVPGVKGGMDLDGRPLPTVDNWQQGLAVVEYNTESGDFDYQPIPVHSDGPVRWARFRGQEYAEEGTYTLTADEAEQGFLA